MLLIISSNLVGSNPAVDLLASRLDIAGIEFVVIDPHDLLGKKVCLSVCGDKYEIKIGGRIIEPKCIYVVRNWRCDSIIRIPHSEKYPGVFRARISQFMNDVRFCFEDARWIPGKQEDIERSESKLRVFNEILRAGLKTPTFTMDSETPEVSKNFEIYKKNMGFPFVVSLNRETGNEVGVTTTNVFLGSSAEFVPDGNFWQWQEPVCGVGQVRCFVVKDKVWSVFWKYPKSNNGKPVDFRFFNQIEKDDIEWKPFMFPDETKKCLVRAMDKLKISVASPEFILRDDGGLIFIDMNPCGDWLGFFSDEVVDEILSVLVELFKN